MDTAPAKPSLREFVQEVRFLINRLHDFERELDGSQKEIIRQYEGHVSPSVERLTKMFKFKEVTGE